MSCLRLLNCMGSKHVEKALNTFVVIKNSIYNHVTVRAILTLSIPLFFCFVSYISWVKYLFFRYLSQPFITLSFF